MFQVKFILTSPDGTTIEAVAALAPDLLERVTKRFATLRAGNLDPLVSQDTFTGQANDLLRNIGPSIEQGVIDLLNNFAETLQTPPKGEGDD